MLYLFATTQTELPAPTFLAHLQPDIQLAVHQARSVFLMACAPQVHLMVIPFSTERLAPTGTGFLATVRGIANRVSDHRPIFWLCCKDRNEALVTKP